ncbi:hypothetical protein DFJ63DRAFT_313139 [Scheffersomyces coipomensis]|uniref:uncharacterized protein n=1 Tax=Scheffersomyces coipomensis TaxID=1788519 RepID=UPI00315D192E
MHLLDLSDDLVIQILHNIDTRELLVIASFAKYSNKLQHALSEVDVRSIILKVDSLEGPPNYLETSDSFNRLTLFHASTINDIIPYQNSSAIYFDTLKWFKHKKQSSIILFFDLRTEEDLNCMIDLLVKCEVLLSYNIIFRLALFGNISFIETSIFTLPSQHLEKFNWSSVSIGTASKVSSEKISTISLYWLKNSPDLSYIYIGELIKIEDNLNDLYFSKLITVKFNSCHKETCENWRHFLLKHKDVVESLQLMYYLHIYDYAAMKNLKVLELVRFNYHSFPILSQLMNSKITLIIKGRPLKCVLFTCLSEAGNKTFPNTYLAEFQPNINVMQFLERRFQINFIPLNPWEDFLYASYLND